MKKAIIVGATSGIGKGIAQLLVKNNYCVGITGRRKELLLEFKNQHPKNTHLKCFDLENATNITQHLEELVSELDGLDLLIISSGTGEINMEFDYALEKQTLEVNVNGFTIVADWAFNYFRQQKSGHLVAITSIAGLRGSQYSPAYNASKAYQINYLEGMRQKVNKLGLPIAITDVRPGFVATNMAKGDGIFWMASVDKATSQIYTAIAKKKKLVYVTKRWMLIAFFLRVLPNFIYERV